MNIIIANNSVILRNILADILIAAKYDVVETTASGRCVMEVVDSSSIDLIILGDNLSEISESEIIKKVSDHSNILAIGSNKLKALGAIETMEKPSMEEVNSREYIDNFLGVVFKCASRKVSKTVINRNRVIKQIVIGSSTGGPNALRDVLNYLPPDFPVPISIVQHLEEGHEVGLATWLNSSCKLKVRVAVDGDIPKPGEVIIGMQNKHLTVKDGVYYFTDEERVNFQKPAVDLQFSSAAKYYKSNLLGVLLTGMGSDGAKGCLDILKYGGETVVQDEDSSIVYGMPKAAAELGAASIILPISKIGKYLVDVVKGSPRDIPQ